MLKNASFSLKLVLAFVLTALVAVGAIGVLVDATVARHFQDYLSGSSRPWLQSLALALEEHYASQGSWEGVDTLLEGDVVRGRGRGAGQEAARGLQPVLANADGVVLYDGTGREEGARLQPGALERAQPIRAEDRIVGYLLAATGAREEQFDANLTRSVIGAGLIAVVAAIVMGLLLTRQALKPLRALRDAARRIGAGDLSYRVPEASGDEIGDLARQFNEMAADLEADETLRRRMMADIAHELRTPLAIMRAQVEALLDGVFALSRENILPIHDAALLLSRLVDDLRDIALADAGRLSLERGEVHVETLIRRVVAGFQRAAEERGLCLRSELPEGLPSVDGDAQRLEQVLGNLLSNALRYTPSGGEIAVHGWPEPGHLAFSVKDNGPGISAEDLPLIFERFYRADNARTRQGGGSGLGLAIAKRLVEAHGGGITVQSEPGEGATFTVRLPALETTP